METEVQQTVAPEVLEALAKIDPQKPMSPELFNALARLTPQVAVESVLMRATSSRLQVYMTRRSPNDTAYPNQLHSPGSILRSGENFEAVLERLSQREFHVPIVSHEAIDEIFFQEQRGWFNNRILLIKADGEPTGGEWYDVDALPEETVEHHATEVIPRATAFFLKRHW